MIKKQRRRFEAEEKLIKRGYDLKEIIDLTGLSIKEAEKLKKIIIFSA